MKRLYTFLQQKPYVGCISLAFILTFVVECLTRHSVLKACSFFVSNPLGFLFNTLIILATLSVTLLFSKRLFGYIIVSAFWLVLGIVSFVLKFYRVTPLSASDFRIFKSISDIFSIYLTKTQGILILVAIVFGLILIPIIWKKTPSWSVSRKKSAIFSGIVIAFLCVTSISASAAFSNFTNLPNAYSNYGFTYCFSLSVVDSGVKKPAGYSIETMHNIANRIVKKENVETSTAQAVTAYANSNTSSNQTVEKTPNIIFIQLESFFDVNDLKNIKFSENPIPNFSALRDSCPSGYVTVPVFGCGTVNTEFEVISGMNLDYFGPNEYPYSTILQDHTCEDICYDLKKDGYSTHAIHNNRATFYDRRHIYANLGFDTFTSLEYMQNVTYNSLGWAQDNILTNEIFKALKSTNEQDFIYTVTVQTHGKYPTTLEDPNDYNITVSGATSDAQESQLTYYADQMHKTDAFLGNLISALSNYDEPTIVVAYGDHLPTIGLTEEDLKGNDLYQTPYIVWSNYGFTMDSQNLYAYQLASDVMKNIGIDDGYINQLHQTRNSNPDYQQDLNALQYDMLYGSQEIFGGTNPYQPTDIKLGINDITITDLQTESNGFYIHGKNFTPFSQVVVGNDIVKTQRISDTLLWVPISSSHPKDGETICVSQVTSKGTILSSSNSIIYKS